MKKLLLLLLASSLSSIRINSSDKAEACDSETSFSFLQSKKSLRAPDCAPRLHAISIATQSLSRNAKMHILKEIITCQRRKMGDTLFDAISEYKKQEDPKKAFIRDYCFSDLEILAKSHNDLGLTFDHKSAIKNIVAAAPEIANAAFESHRLMEKIQTLA